MKLVLKEDMLHLPVIIKIGDSEYRGNSTKIVYDVNKNIESLTMVVDTRGSDCIDLPCEIESIEFNNVNVMLETNCRNIVKCYKCYVEKHRDKEFLIFEGEWDF